MKYYSVMKIHEVLTDAATWINLSLDAEWRRPDQKVTMN